jgi:uncharacterized protein YhdP
MNANVRDWLHRAISRGTSNDVRFVLNGNLADFPFAQGRNGQFLVTIKGQGGALDYAEHWPPISDIDADIRFEGARIVVDASKGKVLGAQLSRTRVEIADLHHPVVRVSGEHPGRLKEFLAFIAQSPVAEWIGHVSDTAQATGDGHPISISSFRSPIRHAATVKGEYQFMGERAANRRRAAVDATERQSSASAAIRSHARDITAEALGGPVKLDVTGSEGRVRVTGTGSVDLANCAVKSARLSSIGFPATPIIR